MRPELLKTVQAQLDEIRIPEACVTFWRVFSFDEKTGEIKMMVAQNNIIPYQGADVMARILAGDATWVPRAMFFEFENTAGVPTVPTPARDEGIDYFLTTLPLTPTKDYLRIPLVVSPSLSASSANYDGNQATFFAVSAGLTGIHGRTFDSSVNSKVYGVALAATPEVAQYTSDRLFSRSYLGFSPIPKEDGYQIGAQYLIRFM